MTRMKELRTEVSCQSDRFDNLWPIHGALLEEAQKLRSEVIALRSSVRVGGAGVRNGDEDRSPKGPRF